MICCQLRDGRRCAGRDAKRAKLEADAQLLPGPEAVLAADGVTVIEAVGTSTPIDDFNVLVEQGRAEEAISQMQVCGAHSPNYP